MTFQQSLLLVIPGFGLLMTIEFLAGKWMKKEVYSNLPDAIASLSSGIASITMATLGIGIGLVSYDWMLANFAIFSFDSHSVLVWVMVIVGLDFAAYWGHRWSHIYNVFWQTHLVHHSSEEFNLPCALRQTVSGRLISFFTFLGLPLAILGIPMEIIAVVSLVHLYYQYWYHTQLIGNLGWIERILVTPEQHSIHHAMNPEYIDKNFGAWFSIWDQMFGTFQTKIEGVEPVYGVTRPVRTWNPIKIDFMHWGLMLRDFFATRGLNQKLKLLVSKTNWRPDDAAAKHPVYSVSDVHRFDKYKPTLSLPTLLWSQAEFYLCLGLLVLYFFQHGSLSETGVMIGGLFILFHVFVYTTVMEGKAALQLLLARALLFGVGFYGFSYDWFGLHALSPLLFGAVMSFFVLAVLQSLLFNRGASAAAYGQANAVKTLA